MNIVLALCKRLPWVVITLAIVAFGTRLFAAASEDSVPPVTNTAESTSGSASESTLGSTRLSAIPTSCVALHKGQLCYQRIQLAWQSTDGERYCLFNQDTDTVLYCSADAQTRYLHAYSSKTSESYSLRRGEEGPVVSSVTVSTSWVYRTGRRSSSGWRLF